MKISLLMPTLERIKEVENLINSLEKQTYQNFELIIVDQNLHSQIEEMVKKKKIDIKYIKSHKKGLSFNRNLGLKYCSGEIITLTDDDAEYPEFLLENMIQEFKKNPDMDFLTISIREKESFRTIHKSPNKDVLINKKNLFRTAISLTTFIKYQRINDIYFDERLGVGGEFGSGEETDMLLNLLHNGYKGKYIYDKNLIIYHPYKDENDYPERFYSYALGAGAVYKKEIFIRKNTSYIYNYLKSILKPFLGIILYIFIKRKRTKYKNILKGRIMGFVLYNLPKRMERKI